MSKRGGAEVAVVRNSDIAEQRRKDNEYVEEQKSAFIGEPDRRGLLRVLGSLAISGARVSSVPLPPLDSESAPADERVQALFVRLTQGGWDSDEGQQLAATLAAHSKTRLYRQVEPPHGREAVHTCDDNGSPRPSSPGPFGRSQESGMALGGSTDH